MFLNSDGCIKPAIVLCNMLTRKYVNSSSKSLNDKKVRKYTQNPYSFGDLDDSIHNKYLI